jgi:hypothetical protein
VDQFQPTLFDKLMMGAAEFLIPFWMPLVIGSLIAIFAKTLLKVVPVPEGPRNLIMRVAGIVRSLAVLLVLFFFGFLFWSLNHASRQAQTMYDQDAIDRAIAP